MMRKRIVLISLIAVIILTFLTGAGFGIAYLLATDENVKFSINDSKTFQRFQGFGASSAWNFRVLGRDFSEDLQERTLSLLYGKVWCEFCNFKV